jgi:hypothetical protein
MLRAEGAAMLSRRGRRKLSPAGVAAFDLVITTERKVRAA